MASRPADNSVLKQITDLHSLAYAELQALWRTLYGKEPTSTNRPFLIKRLAYRIQELAYGGLSERAHKMMDDILDTHGFDENGGKSDARRREQKRKSGMPVAGTRLVREWNGRVYEVIVTYGGFEYEGKLYRSLSAITKVITGTHWNGREFFGLRRKGNEKSGALR
ncbi:MAG: DUF2924 domain-containing protein [Candidatus Marsarchaeota archaeon]|nr:DUF2924 domain-containing protein [Candidatus Marsarchaeota archaeon]